MRSRGARARHRDTHTDICDGLGCPCYAEGRQNARARPLEGQWLIERCHAVLGDDADMRDVMRLANQITEVLA